MSVAQFNQLPRTPLDPSGLVPNHWHFSLRPVPLRPRGLVLFIINPASRFVYVPGRIPLSFFDAPRETMADVIIRILIMAFTKPDLNQSRPWSWSTNNAEMADAVEEGLTEFGVADGLDVVEVAPAEENSIADEEWTNFLNRLRENTRNARNTTN